ncbi:MAG: bifunctional [glutamate--ammonia ligase]-adenylyl-L-tyrosine phosphorylase/[glutamate--ammonia-ligase] adenylyltransferase, partial [Pseudomonadota bacterium]
AQRFELRDIHAKIAIEVARGDRADDLKLGPGGIREVEFLVQSLQLVRGGSEPGLMTTSLLVALERLVEAGTIEPDEADRLRAAYLWLRRVENLVQALRDKQLHALPEDDLDRARLVYALGYDSWGTLRRDYEGHRATVATQFGAVAFPDRADAVRASDYATLWSSSATLEQWQATLETRGIDDAESIARRLAEFRSLSVARNADAQSRARLDAFVPLMLQAAEALDDSATAVDRCLTVVEQILRRSAYLALLNENPPAAKRLIALCERSAYIAEQIASFPVLLDELLDPAMLRDALSKEDIAGELRLAVDGVDPEDAEASMDAIARFQRATMFRIAVADFSDELPIMKVSDSLTFLAEVVLGATLELAWRDLETRHGRPTYVTDGDTHAAGFGIIAYGKLGGLELSYGSDLDIVFVHDSHGGEQVTDGPKPLDNAVFFNRLVRRLIHFLGTRTRTGVLYEVDTRLRPSGRKGLLVTSLDAFDRYQAENAWTWEHQALLRARGVAGDATVCEAFGGIRRKTLESRVRRETLATEVQDMRQKMRRELDRSGGGEFDLKQGEGGIGDIEFIVQYLVLDRAADAHGVIEYSDNIRQLDALTACGALSAERALELQDIYRRYRRRQHRLVLNKRPALVPNGEFQAERATVVRTWGEVFGA